MTLLSAYLRQMKTIFLPKLACEHEQLFVTGNSKQSDVLVHKAIPLSKGENQTHTRTLMNHQKITANEKKCQSQGFLLHFTFS